MMTYSTLLAAPPLVNPSGTIRISKGVNGSYKFYSNKGVISIATPNKFGGYSYKDNKGSYGYTEQTRYGYKFNQTRR